MKNIYNVQLLDDLLLTINNLFFTFNTYFSLLKNKTNLAHSIIGISMFKRLLLIIFFILLLLSFCHKKNLQKSIFFVSPNGSDNWSGRLSEPNHEKTDGPFATLERAKQDVNEIQKSQSQEQIVIEIRKGSYPFLASLILENQNNLIWRAYNDEQVSLIGARKIDGFRPVSDPSVLNRIGKTNQDKIFVCDLKAQGISDYGEITQRGSPGLELFFNGKRMTLARYPNEGWLNIADVPQSGQKLFNKGLEREKRYNGVPIGRHFGRIKYDGDRPKRWAKENEIYVHGYWTWDWSDSYQKVKSIDTEKQEITLVEPHHNYGYTKNQRYYFLNILEELDSPGEWVLDRKNGLLYLYPPTEIENGKSFVSILDQPLISLDNCSNVNFQGLHFEYSRGNGVVINGGSQNLIAGCTFRYLGNNAVEVNGGDHNGVQSCDIYEVALGGIVLKGGDRKTLTPGDNFAINNHIHDYSKLMRTWQLAINLSGVGNRVAHNLIHDAPHEGIYVRGNEHVLEFNEIHNVCNETGDAGAIHTGRNYTWRGNIYRYNYFHHLKGPGLHGVTAIYLDDFTSGYTIYGNICYKSGRGALIGGGRDNTLENNIFIECAPSIVLDARGLGWAGNYFDGSYPVLKDSLEAMNYRESPYSKKYPELLTLYDDNPAVPKNNKIIHNISYGGRWLELYDFFAYDFSVVTVKDNLIADPIILKRIKQDPKGWEPYYLNLDTEEGYVYYKFEDGQIPDELKGNLIINSNPGFNNIENGNFELKKDSPAFKIGFKPIPFEKIGLYVDKYRKYLPD